MAARFRPLVLVRFFLFHCFYVFLEKRRSAGYHSLQLTSEFHRLTTGITGTWQSAPGEVAASVSYALKEGYKLVDCAYCYGNEDEVGQGLREAFASGVKREDIFVMTKVWCTYQTRVEESIDKSLKSLGLDYVDLFLVHWPVAMNPEGNHDKFPTLPTGKRDIVWDHDHVATWKLMEKLVETGKCRGIGVCNYSKRYLEQLLPHCSIVPAINQIENHPNLPQQEIVDLCREKGIHIVAYSPFGSTGGPVMQAEPVVKIAEKRGVSTSTILLSYHGQYSLVHIFRTLCEFF